MTKIGLMESLNLAKAVTVHDGHMCLPITNDHTNVAFRIATWIHIINGSNDLEFLSRYSQHIVAASDNMEQLRGAFGPRMRNHVGAHQLQEMINLNSDITGEEVTEEEKVDENIIDYDDNGDPVYAPPTYVKPEGIDQMRAVYDDLKHGMSDTAIIIRDPGVDFEESDDIPDLIAVSFNGKVINRFDAEEVTTLKATALYGTGNNYNFLTEIWALSLMTQMYKAHLGYTHSRFSVHCYDWNEENDEHNFKLPSDCIPVCGEDHAQFWEDFDHLQRFAKHIQFHLNITTFDNPDVSNEWCINTLNSFFIEKIESPFLQDMAYSLAIWAFWTYGNASPEYAGDYETQIEDMFKLMHHTTIRIETAQFLSDKSLPYTLSEQVKEVMDENAGE